MRLFYIPNLAVNNASFVDMEPGVAPDDMPLPEFPNKAAYRFWCTSEKTDHAFYSLVKGEAPGLRVSAGNEPHMIEGLVGEFDAPQPDGWIEKLADVEHPPTWVSRSFTSGHVRMIWAFARPVGYLNKTFAKEFYRLAWRALKPTHCGVGFKEDESSQPTQYFEFGRGWQAIGNPVPMATVEGWVAKACGKVKWEKQAIAIPIEVLQAEGEKQFPGKWPGGWQNFVVGARGTRFWDNNADAASVIVQPTGCVAYTGEGRFKTWADIFGRQFAAAANAETIGKAIEPIWWEPTANRYWERVEDGKKVQIQRSDLIVRLERAGLSSVTPNGDQFSQVDDAIYAIQRTKLVDGVGPWLYRREDTITCDNVTILNDSMVRLSQPGPDRGEWGKGFPVIAEYMELSYREQLPWVVGWLAYFYRSCLQGEPARGQAIFIAGGSDSGKSFLSFAILRLLFGGQQDASKFLQGQEQFNDKLIACPIWTIDDAVAATDPHARDRFTQIVKQYVANDRVSCRGMHKSPTTVYWLGRIVVTLNDDDDSIRMIPNLDLSVKDKVSLFKAYAIADAFSWPKAHGGKFPMDDDVLIEIPFLAAFLRDCEISPEVWAGGRWGVKPFHHPELTDTASAASDTMASEEALDDWREELFKNTSEIIKEMTLTDMFREIILDAARGRQIRTSKQLSIVISGMRRRGVAWIRDRKSNGRKLFRVLSPRAHTATTKAFMKGEI